MKKPVVFLMFLLWLIGASAQTNIAFQVLLTGASDVPPNQSGDIASGVLTLSGNTLTYYIGMRFGSWTGEIHGPAEPGSNGPLIFDLGGERCAIPNPPSLGGCVFADNVTLTDEQVAQLMAGVWYVRVNPVDRPDLGLRAQITLVPSTIRFQVLLTGANDVPPNESGDTASGALTLSGNTLAYNIGMRFGSWTAEIHGPAEPGSNGPLIFDLGAEKCAIPNPPRLGGCVFAGSVILSHAQIRQLYAGLWYVRVNPADRPELGMRAQITPDADGDCVADILDQCPDTEPGSVVDADGCSIEQLCPCEGPWKKHQEYVKCVKAEALRFFKEGRITQAERHAIVKQAELSNCGKPRTAGTQLGLAY